MTATRTNTTSTDTTKDAVLGEVNCLILKQGGPVFNLGRIKASGPSLLAIEIDLGSKGCEVLCDLKTDEGAPLLVLDSVNAVHLGAGLELENTELSFPDYVGWSVFSAHISRYTLRICLIRDE